MQNKAMFSVIIATKNRRKYLEQTIESLLSQENVSIQIIVVDDGSEDDTQSYMQCLCAVHNNIVYIRNEKSIFAHKARKLGLLQAVGQYIVFADDDDFYIDTMFYEKAKQIFDEHKDVNAVLGATVVYEEGNYFDRTDLGGTGKVDRITYINGFLKEYKKPMSTLSAVFRKEGLNKAKIIESKMVNDTCIYLSGVLFGDVFLYNEIVAAYRIHSTNISKRKFDMDFILDNLNEKKRIYRIACKDNIITDKRKWFYRQLEPTISYFASNTNARLKYSIVVGAWLFINGKGTQLLFLRDLLNKVKRHLVAK